MTKIQLVNREEELSLLENTILEDLEHGKLISISGISGIGKTSFFHLFKQKFESDPDSKFLCLEERVLAIDTPLTFFYRFFSNLESKIHPKKSSLKQLFKKYSVPISLGTKAISSSYGIPIDPSAFFSGDKLNSYQELEHRLSNLFFNFSKKFPEKKLVLLIDDLDKSEQINDFISVIDDIKEKLPSNINLIFTSMEYEIDIDTIISLSNFDKNATNKFAEKNLSTLDKNTIKTIYEKSGGYPTSLSWVWQNYKKDQNITSLIQRLSREGFLNKLQENFLSLLSNKEQSILKVCGHLDLIDCKILNKITGINEQEIQDFFDELLTNSIFIQVNYFELKNKQVLDLFIIEDTFQNLIEIVFGQNLDTHKKILQNYTEFLFEDIFPIKNVIIALLLEQIEKIQKNSKPTLTKKQIILDLKLNIIKKIELITEIYSHYAIARDKIRCKEFAQIQKEISSLIDNPTEKEFYTKLGEINELLAEDKTSEARKKYHDLAAWCESCKQNQGAKPDEIDTIVNALRAFGNLIDFQYENPDDFFKDLLGKGGQEQLKPYYTNAIFQLTSVVSVIGQILILKKYDAVIEVGLECIKKFENISEDDKREFQQINTSSYTVDQFLDIIEYGLKHDLGLAYLLKSIILQEKENFDKNQIKNLLENAVKFLIVSKEDLVRGQYYNLAKTNLDQLE